MLSEQDWNALSEDLQDNIRSVWFGHFMLERQKKILEEKVDEWGRKADEIEDPPEKFSGFGESFSVDLSQPYHEQAQNVPLDANKTIFLYEATRIIHNYYAITYSLYECANNVTDLFDDEFEERYKDELYERKIPRRDVLIRGLRAYMTHKSQNRPFLALSGWAQMTRIEDGGYDHYYSFTVDREPFRDFMESKGKKLDYLDSLDGVKHYPESTDIVEIIREHYDRVSDFYFNWFLDAVVEEATR